MKTILKIFTLSALVLFMGVAIAGDEDQEKENNCKLVVQTRFQNGKKRLQVIETHAYDRNDCRGQAKDREISSDEDIASIKATFGWRPR